MQPRFRAMILSMPCPSDQRTQTVLGQLQITFAHLALTKHSAVDPWAFWSVFKDYDGQPMDTKEHQDCQEFFVSFVSRVLARPARPRPPARPTLRDDDDDAMLTVRGVTPPPTAPPSKRKKHTK